MAATLVGSPAESLHFTLETKVMSCVNYPSRNKTKQDPTHSGCTISEDQCIVWRENGGFPGDVTCVNESINPPLCV